MKVKCLSKNRNNKGAIISYNLQDETGRQFQATGQQIKEEIMKGQFQFVNLQIDRAGRLVDKAEEKQKKVKKYDGIVPDEAILAILNVETIRIFIDRKNKVIDTSKCLEDYLNTDCNISHIGGLVMELHKQTGRNVYFIYAKDNSKIEVAISLVKDNCKIDLSKHKLENAPQKCCFANSLGEYEKPVEVKGTILQCKDEKGSTPKEIVKNFLANMTERYGEDDDSSNERFTRDYNGDEWYLEHILKSPMPKEVKAYFKTLVDSIEKQARESYVSLYDPYEEETSLEDKLFNSHLPESIIKFQKATNCNFGIIKGLFNCVDNEKIAKIRVIDANSIYTNWMYDSEILTANYGYARKYFKSALELVAEFNEEVHRMDVEVEGNDLAQVFYIKYLAELSGRDLNFYKQQIVEKIKTYISEMKYSRGAYVPTKDEVIQWALFGGLPDVKRPDLTDMELRTFAAAYMAIKHNVICHGDDDMNYYDYVKKEIEELTKLV